MRLSPFTLGIVLGLCIAVVQAGNLVCYYDAASFVREGPAQLALNQLSPALQFCNYLIYGYAGIDAQTYELKPLNAPLEIGQDHYRTVVKLKKNHPHLKVLLSVGGDRDIDALPELEASSDPSANKYLTLLEKPEHQRTFTSSALTTMRNYGFDGLDLAWQFPKNPAPLQRSGLKKAWASFKGWFTGAPVVDDHAEEHKAQFTALIRELSVSFEREKLLLTLTMLPHVDSTLFIDIFAVVPNVNFVNLATFDFHTPARNPHIADHPAPLYEMFERSPHHNVHYHVELWLNNTAPAHKLYIGIPSYGRAWTMTQDSGITGFPPIPKADGPAPPGRQTITPGLLSWPEICEYLSANKEATGAAASLRKVGDPTRRFGSYAYRAADELGAHGLWVGYEDPTTAAIKAGYAQAKGLGGVALFDLSLDDFRGQCAREVYPILRSIKYKL